MDVYLVRNRCVDYAWLTLQNLALRHLKVLFLILNKFLIICRICWVKHIVNLNYVVFIRQLVALNILIDAWKSRFLSNSSLLLKDVIISQLLRSRPIFLQQSFLNFWCVHFYNSKLFHSLFFLYFCGVVLMLVFILLYLIKSIFIFLYLVYALNHD